VGVECLSLGVLLEKEGPAADFFQLQGETRDKLIDEISSVLKQTH
jgi:hypothetical protein